MSKNNQSKGAVTTGIIAALAASSCCIPPIVAAIAGIGGAAGSLSWMEAYRPYLMALAVVSIGYAWYNHLKVKEGEDECGCSTEKPKWYQTKGFLIGMTLFAGISMSFPYYAHIFVPDNKKEVVINDPSNLEKVTIEIEGMTCDACQNHVDHAVNELNGIVKVKTSYENGNTIVEFDKTESSLQDIEKAINNTGYKVVK